LNAREENGDEYEPSTISGFQRSIQDSNAYMRRTICLKNPEGYFLRNVSHWLNSTDRDTVRNKDTKEHTSLSFMPPILEMSSQLLQEIPLSSAGGDEYTRVTVSSGGPL
ncbi:unnamed protein product, partial [Pocillopora meandrina]